MQANAHLYPSKHGTKSCFLDPVVRTPNLKSSLRGISKCNLPLLLSMIGVSLGVSLLHITVSSLTSFDCLKYRNISPSLKLNLFIIDFFTG